MIHNDHLATPQKMTDGSGVVVWSADYKPFGETTITVSTITNNLRFPGQYYDAETGLNYNFYRDYNPAIGRYIEADRIGVLGGMNLYGYVANPINRQDSLGLYQWTLADGKYYPAELPSDPYTLGQINCIMNNYQGNITITEGDRTEAQEAILIANGVKPAKHSLHKEGKAIDISANGDPLTQSHLLCAAAKCSFSWGKKYPQSEGGHVHVDTGPTGRSGNDLPNPCSCKAH